MWKPLLPSRQPAPQWPDGTEPGVRRQTEAFLFWGEAAEENGQGTGEAQNACARPQEEGAQPDCEHEVVPTGQEQAS